MKQENSPQHKLSVCPSALCSFLNGFGCFPVLVTAPGQMLNRHMVWMLRVLLSMPVSLQGAALADAIDIHSIAGIPLPA